MSSGIASSFRSFRYANTEGGLGREPCKVMLTGMFLPNFIHILYQHVWWGNESLGMGFLSQMIEFSWPTSLFIVSKLLVLSFFGMPVLCNNTLYLCLLLQSDWITVMLSESNRSLSFLNLDKFRQTFVFMSSFTIIPD